MSKIFQTEDTDLLSFKFHYREREVGDGEVIVDIFDSKYEDPPESFKQGKVYVRNPSWAIMNDISRVSGVMNSYTKKLDIEAYKYRDQKLKKLVVKIEDAEENTTFVDEKFVDSMNPILANFILDKIDEILDWRRHETGLSKEEGRELALDVFRYLKNKKIRDSGKFALLPPMPSIMLITNLCERFHITPDEARRISPRDLEMMSIVAEQEDVINNPAKYGNGPMDAHVKMRGQR